MGQELNWSVSKVCGKLSTTICCCWVDDEKTIIILPLAISACHLCSAWELLKGLSNFCFAAVFLCEDSSQWSPTCTA